MDNIKELKNQFIRLGGDPTIISSINDAETLEFIVQSQKEIMNLKEENIKTDSITHTDMNQAIKKLTKLKAVDTSNIPRDSDAYRSIINQQLVHENEIRESLGLAPKSYEILDSHLQTLIAIVAEEEFLENLKKQDKLLSQQTRERIDRIKMTAQTERDSEEKRIQFLDEANSTLQELECVKPEEYNIYFENEPIYKPYKRKFLAGNKEKDFIEKIDFFKGYKEDGQLHFIGWYGISELYAVS